MKKSWISLIAVVLVTSVLIKTRIQYSEYGNGHPVKVTTWDAFGYYMYLPGLIIYEDVTQLNWVDSIESKYNLTGGHLYQAHIQENGNYVFKYFGGVALLQLPFFLIGHEYALLSDYPPDGFSVPYQWAIALGNIFYALISLLVLRVVLLRFFSDRITAITLVSIVLATNLIQYISVDGAMSHGYIFPLYSLVLFTTVKWHERPSILWAILTGLIIGIATIARPTEAIMILIPILWGTQNKESAARKWALVKQHRSHVYIGALAGLIGVFPQLLYWRLTAGTWIFDVGSKWTFANPWFRVLFGFEKGWFVYTPITLFFIAGMFFIKKLPFRKSVLWFGLLNIYIVISWFEWRYGGSYSTRALSQSYPVYALPFAAFLTHVSNTKWQWPTYALIGYLLFVNLFQIGQYNNTVIHYDHMNRKYYSEVYLTSSPTPIQYSLLDTDEYLDSEEGFSMEYLYSKDSIIDIHTDWATPQIILNTNLDVSNKNAENWLKINIEATVSKGFGNGYIYFDLKNLQTEKSTKIRLFRPRAAFGQPNSYAFYFQIPVELQSSNLQIRIGNETEFTGTVSSINIEILTR